MSSPYIERAKSWLTDNYDQETRLSVKRMIENKSDELIDAFYKNLEFGTGGLRGIMGVGTNRVNKYTIGMATQGLANYMISTFEDKAELSVAIAFDNRNNSKYFASITAEVLSANGFKVYLFDELRPTPVLSFAVRHYGCVGGVMITASHNPKEYNGYKAYWEDGAQVIAPHDANIITEVNKISSPSLVKFKGNPDNIVMIGEETDKAYLDSVLSLSASENNKSSKNLKIVYTPLHGTGVKLVPLALKLSGFNQVYNVPEQDINDGDFPTVKSPNPEEPDALRMALEKAETIGADLVMATDPDGDRVGIAVRDNNGKLVLLNGNQMASLLTYYLLERREELNKSKLLPVHMKDGYMVKTIVTTDLMQEICDSYGVDLYNVLTGFKYIAGVVREKEGERFFIGGGEESYGFNAGEFVRDKDAVLTCTLIAEAAAWSKSRGVSLYQLLIDIYIKYGLYRESLVSVTKKGKDGVEQINNVMKNMRDNPPEKIDGEDVVMIHDYLYSKSTDLKNKTWHTIDLPKSNVLQFVCGDKTVVSVRPSGTEPKIKFYAGVRNSIKSAEVFYEMEAELNKKIDRIFSQISSF